MFTFHFQEFSSKLSYDFKRDYYHMMQYDSVDFDEKKAVMFSILGLCDGGYN